VWQRVVETIKYLATRGFALRGSDENIGSPHNENFLGALELIVKFDPFLQEHLKKYGNGNPGKGNTSYLSSTICDELIAIMGKKVIEEIVLELKISKYYSITCDSTPDITHCDQLSFVVLYIKNSEPIERFLRKIDSHRSEILTEVVLNFLNQHEIDIHNFRGQSYDNAANMSGQYTGLQTRLRGINILIISKFCTMCCTFSQFSWYVYAYYIFKNM
jgi:hypothetical protein